MKKNLIRLAVFLLCAVLALSLFLPDGAKPFSLLLPRISPLLSFAGALGARRFAGCLCLFGVPLLLLAFFKQRWFCWHLCPMGFAAEMAGKLNKRGMGRIRRVPTLNKALALLVAGSAVAGYPLLLWLDPLCIFNGFFAAFRKPFLWTSCATAAGFVLILIVSVAVPNIWCHRLCPLGGLQELLGMPWKRFKSRKNAQKTASGNTPPSPLDTRASRRLFLGILGSGVAGAGARAALGGGGESSVLRPPGAVKRSFNALCARCGNCMRACPYGLLVPDLGKSGIDGLCTPVVAFRHLDPYQEQYCFQDCKACTEVCPTGALVPLTVEQKHKKPVGIAVVDRGKCVAWAEKQYCVVCQEYCPYQAVVEVERNGVMCPEIDAAKCRGCGACESACPADPIAIIVTPCPGGSGK